MSKTRHALLIEHLLARYPMARAKGFGAALRNLLMVDGAPAVIRATIEARRPDAFIVDDGGEAVLAFEVEDHSALPGAGLTHYALLAMYLRDIGFTLHLVMVSRWGAEAPINMTRFMEAQFAKASSTPAWRNRDWSLA